ncbi:MAG: alpha-ketoglutarate-dependent dioxygenase AlkB [Candidatus Eremiobacteraeota bacterium]|nr:alpha-ketoglutarate-dependent dioxygenase AlkB [Candidatus Eremiobacteraeota bacterium]
MPQQESLFPIEPRVLLESDGAAIVYHPAVFSLEESIAHFNWLRTNIAWESGEMWMYDKNVSVPRLTAHYDIGAPLPDQLEALKSRVKTQLGVEFNSVGLNFYRDGNDSVAWHSDHNEVLIDNPVVAVVSFGATREMLIRTKAKPRNSLACTLDTGSVIVMSGTAQQLYEHRIPKSPTPLEPRISVALRQKRT